MTALPPDVILALGNAAREASHAAHCPYSRFPVGAAALADDGSIHSGCNVENASFGLTVCAERVAVLKAVSSGCKTIKAVAVYTPTQLPNTPCGACRQVIMEFGPTAEVVCLCDGDAVVRRNATELLPMPFSPEKEGCFR